MRMTYDVLVIGGTLEGCIAACEAARSGKKVLIAETSGSFGGMATNGLHSYFPAQDVVAQTTAAQSWKDDIFSRLGMVSSPEAAVYDEQQLKIALPRLLKDYGVTFLTHVFPQEALNPTGNRLGGYIVKGKTGAMEVECAAVIDATESSHTLLAGNISTMEARPFEISTSIKMNSIDWSAIKTLSGFSGVVPCQGGETSHFTWKHEYPFAGGISYSGDCQVLYTEHLQQVIFMDAVKSRSASCSPHDVSSAQARLRKGSYDFLESLKKKHGLFSKAHIIHVAQKSNMYGMQEVLTLPVNPYQNLSVCNSGFSRYTNTEALNRGVQAAVAAITP